MFCSGSPNAPNALMRCSTASRPNISRRSFNPLSCRSRVSIALLPHHPAGVPTFSAGSLASRAASHSLAMMGVAAGLDIDDAPPALRHQSRGNCLGHHERPVEVDVDGVAPGAGVDLVEFFPRADEHVADVLHADAGVVDE